MLSPLCIAMDMPNSLRGGKILCLNTIQTQLLDTIQIKTLPK